jgi:hypothetical protein
MDLTANQLVTLSVGSTGKTNDQTSRTWDLLKKWQFETSSKLLCHPVCRVTQNLKVTASGNVITTK